MQATRLNTDKEWEAWIAERDKQGVKVHRVTPSEIDENHKNHLFLFIHGGAWVLSGGLSGTTEVVVIAARLKIPVVSIDYRMPPKHPAPAALID